MRVRLTSDSVECTHRIGRVIGESVSAGQIVLLTGGLGAGKTTLTQGILWGLGADEYARSPTFVLVNEYAARLPVYHMDLYRIDTPGDIDSLGLEDYLYGDGLCVVEWADRARDSFPPDHLHIAIDTLSETRREFVISCDGSAAYSRLFDSISGLELPRSAHGTQRTDGR